MFEAKRKATPKRQCCLDEGCQQESSRVYTHIIFERGSSKSFSCIAPIKRMFRRFGVGGRSVDHRFRFHGSHDPLEIHLHLQLSRSVFGHSLFREAPCLTTSEPAKSIPNLRNCDLSWSLKNLECWKTVHNAIYPLQPTWTFDNIKSSSERCCWLVHLATTRNYQESPKGIIYSRLQTTRLKREKSTLLLPRTLLNPPWSKWPYLQPGNLTRMTGVWSGKFVSTIGHLALCLL